MRSALVVMAALLGGLAALLGGLAAPANAAVTPPAGQVDLYVHGPAVELRPGDVGVSVHRIGNRGPGVATGVELTLVTSFFVNFVRPIPANCTLRYPNLDPLLPETMACKVNRIDPGAVATVETTVVLEPGGPRGRNLGGSFVRSGETDLSLADNVGLFPIYRLHEVGESPG